MEREYVWQGEYGKRNHLIPIFKKLLQEQDASSLNMLEICVNNNPYSLEFFVVVIYGKPKENHIEKMIHLFEKAGLIIRNDITFDFLFKEIANRRYNVCTFLSEETVDLQFDAMFGIPEIESLEERGYFVRPFGKEKQVFISYSSKDEEDIDNIIPYLNAQELPVWFGKRSISVGESITEKVQQGIEESDMVIFWVTENFLLSNWCKFEMNAYVKRLIEDNVQIITVLEDSVNIKSLPLFLRNIKCLRKEGRTTIEVAQEIVKVIKMK